MFLGEWPATGKWALATRGEVFAIVSIDSPRGDWLHCVIGDLYSGRQEWDPFPGAVKKRHLRDDEIKDVIIFVRPLRSILKEPQESNEPELVPVREGKP